MNYYKFHGKELLLLTFISSLSLFISKQTYAQNSRWQVKIGYEHVYVRPAFTNNLAEKTFTWNDPNRGDLVQWRTNLPFGYDLSLGYDVTKWWNVYFGSKQYYRRYYIWSGTYLREPNVGKQPGQFAIVPTVTSLGLRSKFLGTTLRTRSWHLGTEFKHPISKNKKWYLHYILSLNRDQYELDLNTLDTPIDFRADAWYRRIENDERVEYYLQGDFNLRSNNPGNGGYQGSTTLGLGISRQLKKGMAFRIEFGFRNILWTEDLQLDENHWDLDFEYVEFDPNTNQTLYRNTISHEFPLEIGGFYNNISFTFHPFRSKRDDPNYVKKKFNIVPKFLRKKNKTSKKKKSRN